MRNLLLFFCILACSANAAYISTTSATCDGITTTGSLSSSCGSLQLSGATATIYPTLGAGFMVQATAGGQLNGHFNSASAIFQDDFVLTITGGLDQGYFAPCLEGAADYFQGSASASGTFGQTNLVGGRASSYSCSGVQSFQSGVPQTLTLAFSVTASAGSQFGNTPQAGAYVDFARFEFFDLAMQPVSGVTYSLTEVGGPLVPEPATATLLVCGLSIVGWLLRIRRVG